jgi:hypothetical protein
MATPGFVAELGLYQSTGQYSYNVEGVSTYGAGGVTAALCWTVGGLTICNPPIKCPPGTFGPIEGRCIPIVTLLCPDGLPHCNGACPNYQTDPNNCGSCGAKCPVGSPCANGTCQCVGSSTQPYGNCGIQTRTCNNGTWSAWVTTKQPGACAPNTMQTCSTHGTQTCTSSCSWGTCACNSGYSMCNGVCVNFQSDDNNCGGCGEACPANSTCKQGKCQCNAAGSRLCNTKYNSQCVTGQYQNCSCVPVANSTYCGACAPTTCPPSQKCCCASDDVTSYGTTCVCADQSATCPG